MKNRCILFDHVLPPCGCFENIPLEESLGGLMVDIGCREHGLRSERNAAPQTSTEVEQSSRLNIIF